MSDLLPLDGWPIVLNITIKECKCLSPQKGEYIGNGDAYSCKACNGVISGYEYNKRGKEGCFTKEIKEFIMKKKGAENGPLQEEKER